MFMVWSIIREDSYPIDTLYECLLRVYVPSSCSHGSLAAIFFFLQTCFIIPGHVHIPHGHRRRQTPTMRSRHWRGTANPIKGRDNIVTSWFGNYIMTYSHPQPTLLAQASRISIVLPTTTCCSGSPYFHLSNRVDDPNLFTMKNNMCCSWSLSFDTSE